MSKFFFIGNTLSAVGNAANEGSVVMREVKDSLVKLNKPLVCVVWGIVALIYLDVYNNVSNNEKGPAYSFYIGKVLLEAFFYALFFALWGDIFNEYPLRRRLKFLNETYKRIQSLDLTEDSFLIPFFFGSSCVVISLCAPFWICIIHGALSGIVYQKINKSIILRPNDYTIDGNHIYRHKEIKGETVDAIIKWDYKAPEQTNTFNVELVNKNNSIIKNKKQDWIFI
tara:strand:- start:6567 stop:7244 length:678 start_codon:yes stop_codon:yes gene_type:complete